jgi:hypothetical protein
VSSTSWGNFVAGRTVSGAVDNFSESIGVVAVGLFRISLPNSFPDLERGVFTHGASLLSQSFGQSHAVKSLSETSARVSVPCIYALASHSKAMRSDLRREPKQTLL